MPKSIKPKMSKDMLDSFDSKITSIEYDQGCVVITCVDINQEEEYYEFDEADLQKMLLFLRINKEKK